MKKAVFYGDSNTWGYDPRDILNDRYPEEKIWPGLAGELAGWQTVNAGMNGRCVPAPAGYGWVDSLLFDCVPFDLVGVMLGTNDLWNEAVPSAERVAESLEGLMLHLKERWPGAELLLIAPPEMRFPEPHGSASRALAPACAEIAVRLGIRFADASAWELPLAADGVHLTEEAHEIFARRMAEILREIELGC